MTTATSQEPPEGPAAGPARDVPEVVRGTAPVPADPPTGKTAKRQADLVSRTRVIAQAWALLGDSVDALTNSTGKPLARTVKLILDPLVIRPAANPHLAQQLLAPEPAAQLVAAIGEAGAELAAASAWFKVIKRARRAAGITDGNPQDLYFQRCFELAHTRGHPDGGADASGIAADVLDDIHGAAPELSPATLRAFLADPAHRARLETRLATAWEGRAPDVVPDFPGHDLPGAGAQGGVARVGSAHETVGFQASIMPAAITELLAACAGGAVPDAAAALAAAVAEHAGAEAALTLDAPGTAARAGLSEREVPARPDLGDQASKRDLPRPFDRSIYQRLFAVITSGAAAEDLGSLPEIVGAEIARCAAPAQLSREDSRVVLAAGADASTALQEADAGRAVGRADAGRDEVGPVAAGRNASRRATPEGALAVGDATSPDARTDTPAHRGLRSRWHREAALRRVLRLPATGALPSTEVSTAGALPTRSAVDAGGAGPERGTGTRDSVRQQYIRRLWVRLHGRELRGQDLAGSEVWPLLDGVLRSVVLDLRHRGKRSLDAELRGAA